MNENTNKNRPTHTIFKVVGDGENAKWIKVGVGFRHKDNRGLHLVFDGIPVDGHIAVRQIKKQKPRQAQQPSLNM